MGSLLGPGGGLVGMLSLKAQKGAHLQRGLSGGVSRVDGRSGTQQRAHHRGVAPCGGEGERSPAKGAVLRDEAVLRQHAGYWPLHDIAIISIVWYMAYKRGVGGGAYIAR